MRTSRKRKVKDDIDMFLGIEDALETAYPHMIYRHPWITGEDELVVRSYMNLNKVLSGRLRELALDIFVELCREDGIIN